MWPVCKFILIFVTENKTIWIIYNAGIINLELKNMTKKTYEKPSMKVVVLHRCNRLLAGSGGLGQPNGYPGGGNPFGG